MKKSQFSKPPFDREKSYKIITSRNGRTSPEDFDLKELDAFVRVAPEFDRIFGDNVKK